MTVFTLPDLGEGLQEAEIVAWHVSQGDHVMTDQPLLSVETDKAVVEVPSPNSGTVKQIIAQEGEVIAIGAPLIDIVTGTADDKGAIVGELAQHTLTASTANKPDAGGTAPAPSTAKATPAVRQLAREKGIDLASVTGSGPRGTILSSDILAAETGSGSGQPLRGVRRSMALAMARSRDSVVPATVTDRADIHSWSANEDPTLRLVQALAVACRAEPALNAWFDGQERQVHTHVDLAIAVDTPGGLFTPVLRAVHTRSNLSTRIADLKAAVAARTIAPEALRGATITLSNFGMLGGAFAQLVVTPPQVAILGAGRIEEACVAQDGQTVVRRVLPLSLTFDHRVVTGAEAARFLCAARTDLERPSQAARD
ncbi:2-oxo acid dehydrogenase subunit E2 [Roseobacter sp. YSTF-M11]|uniref:Dihydrolipoamide acetyltransferase component of pyruvate dehydrogenase complex n=1 Tax=Roseobacter insulae TaxID=2859783 RepID=A0A9X1FTG9_9RHOB|nr:dihydrolipoamide acetyltransferase family protein [Roseobacter insulae]MBW4706810.1 2-oxo acid dehydrogenase subunit E2 [Roseobacter insulae]